MDIPRTSPCNLCPRLCGARRDQGQRGVCGAGERPVVARAALHFWEEPPLSGTAGSGAVFFAGCPLQCAYCQNAAIASPAAAHGGAAAGVATRELDESQLADVFLNLQSQGSLNVNCVTPTHFSLAIARAVAIARGRGLRIPVLWNTSGYERPQVVRALAGTVDVFLTDFKYADPHLARRYSQAPDYPQAVLDAIDAMLEGAGEPRFDQVDGQPRLVRGVVVRHLVLPGAVGQSERALDLLFGRYGNRVLYSIMNQYTPVAGAAVFERFPELARRVPDAEYERLLDHADALGMEDYFWQEGPAAQESFIPAWDATGL